MIILVMKFIIFLLIFSSYAKPTDIKKIEHYSSRNEEVERTYKNYQNFIFVDIKINNLKTKRLIRKTFSYITPFQSQNSAQNCLKPIYDSLTMDKKALSAFSKIVEFDDRFFKTKYGVLIERSCINKTSKKYMEENIISSYQGGVRCLEGLNTETSKKLLNKLGNIFKDVNNPPKIFCNNSEKDIFSKGITWDSTAAYASSGKKYDTTEMKHPFISFNPKGEWRYNPYKFQGTIFHELFHNTGDQHTESIERAYSCQSCCFNNIDNSELMMSSTDQAVLAKELACKVCKSKYQGISDKKYIKDFTEFRIADSRLERLFPILKVYMKEGPKDNLALEMLSKADRSGNNKISTYIDELIAGEDIELSNDAAKFAKGIYHYSRGEYPQSANAVKSIKPWSSFVTDSYYKNIFDDISKDLFFISLTDSSFDMKQTNDTFLNNFFKSASKDFTPL